MRSYHALLSVALLLATAGGVMAQEFRATIKGQVVDSSQASLPGATATALNQETGEIATAVTNRDGSYTIPFLRPGLYTLTVEMPSFQKYTRKDMRLQVGETAAINVTLSIGGVTENVTVSAGTPARVSVDMRKPKS